MLGHRLEEGPAVGPDVDRRSVPVSARKLEGDQLFVGLVSVDAVDEGLVEIEDQAFLGGLFAGGQVLVRVGLDRHCVFEPVHEGVGGQKVLPVELADLVV
jgi:hypothetical protein